MEKMCQQIKVFMVAKRRRANSVQTTTNKGCDVIINIDFGNDGVSVTAELTRDGDRWCVLLGDNIQDGICGFGSQTGEAIGAFKDEFRNITADSFKQVPNKASGEELIPGTMAALGRLTTNKG